MSEGAPQTNATTDTTSPTLSPAAPAASPAAAPAQIQDWTTLRASLPTELRDNPIFSPYGEGDTPSGFAGLAKDHAELQKLVGGERITKPKKDDADDLQRFYNELGRPERVEGYDLGDFAAPEGLPWDTDLQTGMLADMHEAGLNNDQVGALMRGYAKRQGETFQATQASSNQARGELEANLRAEWGLEYDANIEFTKRGFEIAFGENADLVSKLPLPDGSLLGNHPAFLKGFYTLGKSLREDAFIGERQSGTSPLMSPEQARQELAIMEHPSSETAKAITNISHQDHVSVSAKWRALQELANPPVA